MPPGPGRRRPAASSYRGGRGPLLLPGPNAPTEASPAEVEAVQPLQGIRNSAGAAGPRCPSGPRGRGPDRPGGGQGLPPPRPGLAPCRPVPDPGERSSPPPSPPRSRSRRRLRRGCGQPRAPTFRLGYAPHRGASQPEVGLPPAPTADPAGGSSIAPGCAAGAWVRGRELPERLTARRGRRRCSHPGDRGGDPAGAPRAGTRRGDGGAQRLSRRPAGSPRRPLRAAQVIAGHVDQDRAGGVLPAARPVARRPDPRSGPTAAGCGSWSRGRAATPRTASPPTRCSGRSRRLPSRLITCAGDFDRARAATATTWWCSPG